MKTVVLTNVGTPQTAQPEDVGIYLREFLMDENIISIPRPFRDFLVKVLIVPKRKFASAEKYQKVWTDQGSPLMVYSENLQRGLQEKLGPGYRVVLGMQIGKPALQEVWKNLSANEEIYFCPLYPQFATATTGGAIQSIKGDLAQSTKMQVLKPFYSSDWYLKSQANKIRERLNAQDHLLLSFHGLPVSQLQKKNSGCSKSENCCEQMDSCLKNCYKAQCLETARLLQRELNLNSLSVGFQSRLGRAKWIEPSTDHVVNELLAKGVKHLKVACPSFVADCLETLEEIGLELKSQFLKGGGESFELIPCVNSSEDFIQGLATAIQNPAKEFITVKSSFAL